MTFKLSQRSLGNLEGVDKRLQKAVHHAIGETKVDFGVICGLRTIEEQRELVAKGASQTLKSKHLDGEAVDLMAYIGGGRASWELNLYDDIADAMRKSAELANVPDALGCRLAHHGHPRLEGHDGRGHERVH
jgi:peptidoglycan LD-endopeptidase CwlK